MAVPFLVVPFLVREARELGWAASGRNGGFCEASLTHGEKNGLRRWPEEYDTLYRMGIENLEVGTKGTPTLAKCLKGPTRSFTEPTAKEIGLRA